MSDKSDLQLDYQIYQIRQQIENKILHPIAYRFKSKKSDADLLHDIYDNAQKISNEIKPENTKFSIINLDSILKSLDMDLNRKQIELRNYQMLLKDNHDYVELIDQLNLFVEVNHEPVKVTRANLGNYTITQEMVKFSIHKLQNQIASIKSDIEFAKKTLK